MPLNDKDFFDRGKFLGQVQCYYVNKVKKDDEIKGMRRKWK
jgi:hypothetical protein